MSGNGPIRLGNREFPSMKVSFLALKGLLEFFGLGELNIGKTFGPVGFFVFWDEDLSDEGQALLLEERLNVFLFALEGQVLQE